VRLPAFITNYKQSRARKKYEREQELRAQQGEDGVKRVARNAKDYTGGGSAG
jgi:hypothetical protein